MTDYSKLKVDELRQILVENYEIVPSSIEKMKKQQLIDTIEDFEKHSVDDDLDSYDIADQVEIHLSGETKGDAAKDLSPSDPEWHDYVISHLTEQEMFHNRPTVDGLRRVVELIMDGVSDMSTTVVQSPTPDNERRATVVVEILVGGRKFSGAADAYYGNANTEIEGQRICEYPVALAETRAEGRALKRALGLRLINAAEEISNNNDPNTDSDFITDTQISFIDTMCKNSARGMNINIEKFVEKHLPGKVGSIKKLAHGQAVIFIELLTDLQRGEITVSPEVVGYQDDWKNRFH
jgi:hypothetical protein